MVVEDEAVVAMDLKANLMRLGYQVSDVVANGPEAIRRAEQNQPHVILMDINLDGPMNGLEAATLINKKTATAVVFLTAHNDNNMIKLGRDAGAFGFLTKPYDERCLKSTIEMAHARYLDMIEMQRLNKELQSSLDKIELLRKHIPMCSWCKQIRINDGSWQQIDKYLMENSPIEFTHGICPVCKKTVLKKHD